MKISGTDPKTGEKVEIETSGIDNDFIQSMSDFKISDTDIKRMIDNLNVSADAKAAIFTLAKITIKVGQKVVHLGRKIIDFIASVFKEYPNASFGLIFGGIVGYLISSIPFLGKILGPIVTPILMALGLVVGLYNDIQDKALQRRVMEINSQFSAFNTSE